MGKTNSIMVSELSLVVKYKYNMILLINGSKSTKESSKQNRTRDTEIKNMKLEKTGIHAACDTLNPISRDRD